jgi:hypothetical protein
MICTVVLLSANLCTDARTQSATQMQQLVAFSERVASDEGKKTWPHKRGTTMYCNYINLISENILFLNNSIRFSSFHSKDKLCILNTI